MIRLEPESMRLLVWQRPCGISRASREAAALEEGDAGAFPENMMEGLGEYASCRAALSVASSCRHCCRRMRRSGGGRGSPDRDFHKTF